MKKNVIVLTHGWAGSSAFTALIGQAGYWYGDRTFEKIDYDTYENIKLIELNNRLLRELGFKGNREHEIVDIKIIEDLACKAETIDLTPYKEFIEHCQQNKFWIWKDPRLTWTIRIWAQLLPLEDVAFIILTRNHDQAWVSSNLRRHIQSPSFTRDYNCAITDSLKKFLNENKQDYVEFQFEDLQLTPEDTIVKLNNFLGTQLTMEHLKSIYKFPLYKKTQGLTDKLIALAIYLKNYRYRDHRYKDLVQG
ncbi:MAG: hypothetical protein K0U40_01930 [Betaproteobacteria bacterium]|nr:hypothetical protein [Betaproteobacteria bacterium]